MRRGIAVALVGFVALAGGCASPARYVERTGDSGIVAIPADTNTWPNYNRREAEMLIQKHVGPNYEIVKQGEVVVGQTTTNTQQTNTEAVPNKRNPNMPGERQTTTGTAMQQDVKEFRIWYKRKVGPMNYDQPAGGIPGGVVPTGGTQGPGASMVPSVLPGGGVPIRGATGPTSYFAPSSRPGSVKPACSA